MKYDYFVGNRKVSTNFPPFKIKELRGKFQSDNEFNEFMEELWEISQQTDKSSIFKTALKKMMTNIPERTL